MSYKSIYRSDLFEGQVMVVTGGGSGIGRCAAHVPRPNDKTLPFDGFHLEAPPRLLVEGPKKHSTRAAKGGHA